MLAVSFSAVDSVHAGETHWTIWMLSRLLSRYGGRRLIVRRTRLLGPQAELWPDWAALLLLTNRDEDLVLVEAEHHEHAVVEQVIADLRPGPTPGLRASPPPHRGLPVVPDTTARHDQTLSEIRA
jgi:hypothetical protein